MPPRRKAPPKAKGKAKSKAKAKPKAKGRPTGKAKAKAPGRVKAEVPPPPTESEEGDEDHNGGELVINEGGSADETVGPNAGEEEVEENAEKEARDESSPKQGYVAPGEVENWRRLGLFGTGPRPDQISAPEDESEQPEENPAVQTGGPEDAHPPAEAGEGDSQQDIAIFEDETLTIRPLINYRRTKRSENSDEEVLPGDVNAALATATHTSGLAEPTAPKAGALPTGRMAPNPNPLWPPSDSDSEETSSHEEEPEGNDHNALQIPPTDEEDEVGREHEEQASPADGSLRDSDYDAWQQQAPEQQQCRQEEAHAAEYAGHAGQLYGRAGDETVNASEEHELQQAIAASLGNAVDDEAIANAIQAAELGQVARPATANQQNIGSAKAAQPKARPTKGSGKGGEIPTPVNILTANVSASSNAAPTLAQQEGMMAQLGQENWLTQLRVMRRQYEKEKKKNEELLQQLKGQKREPTGASALSSLANKKPAEEKMTPHKGPAPCQQEEYAKKLKRACAGGVPGQNQGTKRRLIDPAEQGQKQSRKRRPEAESIELAQQGHQHNPTPTKGSGIPDRANKVRQQEEWKCIGKKQKKKGKSSRMRTKEDFSSDPDSSDSSSEDSSSSDNDDPSQNPLGVKPSSGTASGRNRWSMRAHGDERRTLDISELEYEGTSATDREMFLALKEKLLEGQGVPPSLVQDIRARLLKTKNGKVHLTVRRFLTWRDLLGGALSVQFATIDARPYDVNTRALVWVCAAYDVSKLAAARASALPKSHVVCEAEASELVEILRETARNSVNEAIFFMEAGVAPCTEELKREVRRLRAAPADRVTPERAKKLFSVEAFNNAESNRHYFELLVQSVLNIYHSSETQKGSQVRQYIQTLHREWARVQSECKGLATERLAAKSWISVLEKVVTFCSDFFNNLVMATPPTRFYSQMIVHVGDMALTAKLDTRGVNEYLSEKAEALSKKRKQGVAAREDPETKPPRRSDWQQPRRQNDWDKRGEWDKRGDDREKRWKQRNETGRNNWRSGEKGKQAEAPMAILARCKEAEWPREVTKGINCPWASCFASNCRFAHGSGQTVKNVEELNEAVQRIQKKLDTGSRSVTLKPKKSVKFDVESSDKEDKEELSTSKEKEE